MQYSIFITSALAGLAAACTTPNTANPPSGNAISAPLNEVVPAGKPFTIKWKPDTPGKVCVKLLKGPSTNVVPIATIADSMDNTGSLTWTPDPSLEPTSDAHGYGIQIIVEGTGQYQYSTQFGISKADGSVVISSSSSASASGSASASSSASAGSASMSGTTKTAETVITFTTTTSCSTGATAVVTAPTGSGAVMSPIVSPSPAPSMPSSLGSAAPGTTAGPMAGAGSASAGNSTSPKTNSVATGGAAGAQLPGAVALLAGLLGFLAL